MCVQVCPTGIDIRKGLQYERIGCSACIDICDDVMDKMNTPKGLIRYTTQNAIDGGTIRVVRPRVVVYGVILLALSGLFAWRLAVRLPIGIDILHDRNQLYRETNGRIENVYQVKVMNKDSESHEYRLDVSGIDGLTLRLDTPTIRVPAGAILALPVALQADEAALGARILPVRFRVTAIDQPALVADADARFLGPQQ